MGQYTQTQCPYCVTGAPWEVAQKVWPDRKERQDKGIDTDTHTESRRPVGMGSVRDECVFECVFVS